VPAQLLAVPNVSEGSDAARVDDLRAAFSRGASLLDVHSDADHNRSVYTLVGDDDALVDALVAGIAAARERIDLREHEGAHPRVGAADVVPLVRFAPDDDRPERAARLLELAGGDPLAITGRQITEAAAAGDGVARDAFAQIGYWLGVAFWGLAQALDPQILVVGGGVVDAVVVVMTPTQTTYRDQLKQRGRFPVADVVAAEMGNNAGVVGAADLARRI